MFVDKEISRASIFNHVNSIKQATVPGRGGGGGFSHKL